MVAELWFANPESCSESAAIIERSRAQIQINGQSFEKVVMQKKQTYKVKGEPATAALSLKNLPAGTTEEGLLQGLNGVQVNPTGTTLYVSDQPQDVGSELWFADFPSCN